MGHSNRGDRRRQDSAPPSPPAPGSILPWGPAMPSVECPPQRDLLAFHLGQLPDDALAAIATHLETCPTCERFLTEMDRRPDPVLADLQHILSRCPQDRAGRLAAQFLD